MTLLLSQILKSHRTFEISLKVADNLNIKLKKCEFLKRSVVVFGYEIEKYLIRSCLSKTNDLNKYAEPKSIKQIQRFCGFTNNFRKFIDNYVSIEKPLTDSTKKDTPSKFGNAERQAFHELKSKIISRPVLKLYDPEAETQLHSDASKFATENWFSYELELYAIFLAATKFRNYLIDSHFKIITDCQALKTVQTKKDI